MGINDTLHAVQAASTWDERVQAIRRIPELHGTSEQSSVYAAIAQALYVPALSPQFAHIPWREEYELEAFASSFRLAKEMTAGFSRVSQRELVSVLQKAPDTLRVFRMILGYTPGELAAAATEIAHGDGRSKVTAGRVKSMEAGRRPSADLANDFATVITRLLDGQMWASRAGDVRSKIDKPDTKNGWTTVQQYTRDGVPYEILLHQRLYGGAFRQLLDGTSGARGELLESPLEDLLVSNGIAHIQTGSHNQAEIGHRFGLTVRPAPDFVVYQSPNVLRAIIECKQANDGGTARDKAARFRSLRQEANRLGGVPLFAILDGLGWERTNDALGPVVRDTDGRVFTLATLSEILRAQPFPQLLALQGAAQPNEGNA